VKSSISELQELGKLGSSMPKDVSMNFTLATLGGRTVEEKRLVL